MSASFQLPNPLAILLFPNSETMVHAPLHLQSPFTFLILFLFLFFFTFLILKSKTLITKRIPRLPPGPTPWPIVGTLPELAKQKSAFRWIHGLMEELKTEITCVKLGSVHVIPVVSPEIAREFLKKHDAVFASRPITPVSGLLSKGFLTTVLTPWGDQWKKMKRVLTAEVLNKPAMQSWLLQKRTEEADNLLLFLYNQCMFSDSSVVNVRKAVRYYTGSVARKMMFNRRYFGEGRKDGGPGLEEEEHVESLFTSFTYLYAFSPSDYLPWVRVFDLDGHQKIIKEALRIVDKYHDPIVDERIKQWRSHGEEKEIGDILDVLITLKDERGQPLLSSEEIKAQIIEMMLATVDNPAQVAEWTLAEMINQPEIMEKAVEEIDRVVGKERLVQESDIGNLNYIKACAREALRLHPMAPFNVPHVSMADAIVAGYFIPKGSHVLLSKVGLGRNPRVWEDPLRFNPERHMNDDKVELAEPELRFISFSTGRRGCAGYAVGTAMTVTLLGRLLQGFSWSAPQIGKAIDLEESMNELLLAKPLHAHAAPRLHALMYGN